MTKIALLPPNSGEICRRQRSLAAAPPHPLFLSLLSSALLSLPSPLKLTLTLCCMETGMGSRRDKFEKVRVRGHGYVNIYMHIYYILK